MPQATKKFIIKIIASHLTMEVDWVIYDVSAIAVPNKFNLIMLSRLLLLLTFVLISNATSAFENKCEQQIDVTTANVPPLVAIAKGKPTGKISNTVRRFLKPRLSEVNITAAPWARSLMLAKVGQKDAIYPTMYSKERSEYLDFSLPKISMVSVSLYQNRANNFNHDKTVLGAEHTIAVTRSVHFDRSVLNGAALFEVEGFYQAVQMLEANRVDYVIGVTEIVDHLIAQNKISDIQRTTTLGQYPVYLALSKTSPNYFNLRRCLSLSSSHLTTSSLTTN